MNDQSKTKLTRRDFLRVLGLGAGAVVVGAAVKPVAAAPALSANPSYEYRRFADPAGRSQRPWWVRTVDQPTMEIDWTKMKRYNEGYKADLGTGTVRGKGFEVYVGKDKNAELVQKSVDVLKAGIANKTPGYTLKDQALVSGNSPRVPMSFLGPQKAKTPEDFGAPKWSGTPEEASRILRAALRHMGAATAGFVELDEILEKADIITLHVPLNLDGPDKTFHLADDAFFSKVVKHPVIINSCRGEVTDTQSLKSALKSGQISGSVIDCWENEPELDKELLDLVDLATPHIAGYSKDGKANGTSMSVRALSKFFGLGINSWKCQDVELPKSTDIIIDGTGKTLQQILAEAIFATYDIREDDLRLRNSVETFEKQRGDYPVRREFPTFCIFCKINNTKTIDKLKQLGFRF